MCFLPLGCLKCVTTLGAVISIVISFALLGVTIYANIQKKQIIDRASEGFINTALVLLYIGSIIFLLLGIAGLYGSLKGGKDKKGSPFLLALYSIGIFIFFLLFLGGAIFFFVGPKTIFGTDCTSGSHVDLVKDLYNQSNNVYSTFCKEGCPCYVQPDDNHKDLMTYLNLNGFTSLTTVTTDPTQYQKCAGYQQNNNILLLAALEKLLNCGGWCPTDPKFYRFTNINDCGTYNCINNLQTCHQAFQGFMVDKGTTMGLGCLLAMLICLLNIITACCICCHPTKSGKKKNFYSRMLDVQN